MIKSFLRYYRQLPWFKGKLRTGKFLFKRYINRPVPVSFTAHQHIQYKIPNTLESLGIELLINGIYERKITRFLNAQIMEGTIFFDIGANVGAIGLPVVKNKPGVHYIGFEASPVVFEFLEYNFKENKIENYSLHNHLVHEKDGVSLKFYQSEQNGKSSLAPTYTTEYIMVNSISLDSFCHDHTISHIHWMKVDVQGFELYVFRGMQQLLRNKQVDNILFEFEYWAEEDAGLERGAAQKYIRDMGYEMFEISGKKITEIITEDRAMIWAKPGVSVYE